MQPACEFAEHLSAILVLTLTTVVFSAQHLAIFQLSLVMGALIWWSAWAMHYIIDESDIFTRLA